MVLTILGNNENVSKIFWLFTPWFIYFKNLYWYWNPLQFTIIVMKAIAISFHAPSEYDPNLHQSGKWPYY
jgi:hypothetical protein